MQATACRALVFAKAGGVRKVKRHHLEALTFRG
jgi:hypothetical protein